MHRGGGKLPLPLSALPPSLTTLAVKKVLLHQPLRQPAAGRSDGSSGGGGWQQQGAEAAAAPLGGADDEPGCHALASPGFRRIGSSGCFTPGELRSLSASPVCSEPSCEAAAAGSGATSCALPQLRRLFLKNCLVAASTLPALLGVGGVQPAVEAAAGASSCSCGGAWGVAGGGRQLEQLSVAGDSATLGEVGDTWSAWLAAVWQLQSLQVRGAACCVAAQCAACMLLPRSSCAMHADSACTLAVNSCRCWT